MKLLGPKKLPRNVIALACASRDSMDCKHDLNTHASPQPNPRTLQLKQLILTLAKWREEERRVREILTLVEGREEGRRVREIHTLERESVK